MSILVVVQDVVRRHEMMVDIATVDYSPSAYVASVEYQDASPEDRGFVELDAVNSSADPSGSGNGVEYLVLVVADLELVDSSAQVNTAFVGGSSDRNCDHDHHQA